MLLTVLPICITTDKAAQLSARRFQAAAAASILGAYAFLLMSVPAPGIVAGSYQRSANLL
jgi:hypothetical protein